MITFPRIIAAISGIGLLTNLIWENVQAPFYQGYTNFWSHLLICSIAAVGDVVIILLMYAGFALIYRDMYWIKRMNSKKVLWLSVTGVITAYFIEIWALSRGRWAYASAMPQIFNVSLLALLQMMILPTITFYLARRFIKSY